MLTHGICQNSLVVWSSLYLMTDSFQEHVKLTVRLITTFTYVSGQGAIVSTNNVRTFSNMSIAGYLAGRPNGNMITRKIRKPVPEDSLVSQEVDEIETGQTEPRVSVYQC